MELLSRASHFLSLRESSRVGAIAPKGANARAIVAAKVLAIAAVVLGSSVPAPAATVARSLTELQVDNALLFEGVNNTLKLLGDQYLARLYRTANRRFHLDDWDSSILRKLQTLESTYEKISGQATNQRMEVLEWVIIFLIAFSILLEFIH